MWRDTNPRSIYASNQTPWRLVSTGVPLAIALVPLGLLGCSDDDTDSDCAGVATTPAEREPVEQPEDAAPMQPPPPPPPDQPWA